MRLLRQAHEFEYRDAAGIDRLGQADVWEMGGGERAVLVLRGLAASGSARPQLLSQAQQARGYLSHTWLPFLVPNAELDVLVVYTGEQGQTRALLLA
ncbi:hypothetical protein DKM44_05715 [Deinococcus irradiatisoli]|uniref:Uncharacterized protein n=1 Tax=Deinococcus irradiatisoli TaxID=2202254 RepID=A0A2Z3JVL1_9DEIO|nr:hypothetical protein [Deinococcus irradiatisoli]AWN24504.1 hypothetical protein DKM44_05715 [Deinococcus irradiatisoli]